MRAVKLASARHTRAKSLVVAVALAGALALVQGTPALAVDPNPASTNMNLTIDQTQIVALIPTNVPIAVKGDGEFVVPEVTLENQSVFAVHVAKVKATASATPTPFTLTAKGDPFAAATSDDTLWMTVRAGTHELDLSTATGEAGADTQAGQWNMAKATTAQGDDTDKLTLTLAGAVKNATSLKTDTPATALTVQWTLAAGAVTAAP